MRFLIRRGGPADALDIATMHVRAWRAAYQGIVPDDVLAELSIPDRAERWREQLADDSEQQRTFVAEHEGMVMGFVASGPSRDPFADTRGGEVYAIYVDPDSWGRGIGSSLLAHAVEDLRAHGYTHATLWVLAANDGARRFYEAHGWERDGSTKLYRAGEIELEEVRYRIEL
jgi:ribosomal protein S18 acetylase RimI-like enzyme